MFLRKVLKYVKSDYIILGRWNSVINKSSFEKNNKELWEKYVDMANMDNCCCSSKSKLHSFFRDIK